MHGPITKLEFEPALMGDNGVYMMIGKVAAIFADQTDKLLMDAIIQEAIKIGITELYVLNKDFIISAIREKMESEEGGISVERMNPKPLEDFSMWAMLQSGGQKANIQMLKALVQDWIKLATQKTAGQRGGKGLSWDNLERIKMGILCEAVALVLSGKLDELEED